MIKNGEIYGEKCRLVKYCVFKTVQRFGDIHFISALSIKEANNTRAYVREVCCWRARRAKKRIHTNKRAYINNKNYGERSKMEI